MKAWILPLACMLSAALVQANASDPQSDPASKEATPASQAAPAAKDASKPAAGEEDELKALVKLIEADLAEVLKKNKPSTETAAKIKAFKVTPENVAAVKTQILAQRPAPLNLYVANVLMGQVILGGKPVVAEVLPVTKRLVPAPGAYPSYPVYDAASLAALKGTVTGGANALKAIADAQKRKEQKEEADRKVQIHCQQIRLAIKNVCTMALMMQNAGDDAYVLRVLTDLEAAREYDYIEAVAALRAAAADMDAKRAALLYTNAKTLGDKLMFVKAKYNDRAGAGLLADANTVPKPVDDYPGIRVLELVNQLASSAKREAVKVPTNKEVDAYIKANSPPKKKN
jgi:hypothetical protein